jgi:CheY-like chemotaxis protein
MCHVLIIEDEPLIAMTLQSLTEENGATSTDIVDTEVDAIRSAARRTPDVIISDVNLRSGTGPDAVAAIRSASGPVPVIFITAMPRDSLKTSARDQVLGKPIDELSIARAFRQARAA